MSTRGKNTMPAARRKLLRRLSVKPYCPITFDTISAVAHLANSAGCSETGPSEIHEREPLMSCAMKGVMSSKAIIDQ